METLSDAQQKMIWDGFKKFAIQYVIQALKDPLNPTRCAGVLYYALQLHIEEKQIPVQLCITLHKFLLAQRTDNQLKAILQKLEKCTCKDDAYKFHRTYTDHVESERKAGTSSIYMEDKAATFVHMAFGILQYALCDGRMNVADVKKGVFKRWPRKISDILPNGPDQLVQVFIQWNRFIPWIYMAYVARSLVAVAAICADLLPESFIKFDAMNKLFLDLGQTAMWSHLRLLEEGKTPDYFTTAMLDIILRTFIDVLSLVYTYPGKAFGLMRGNESKVLQLCSVILYLIPTFSCGYDEGFHTLFHIIVDFARLVSRFHTLRLFGRRDFKVYPALVIQDESPTNTEMLNLSESIITRAMVVGRRDRICGNTHCNVSFADISDAFKLCDRCLSSGYCSRSCQIKDWRNETFSHKRVCPILCNIIDTRGGWKAPVAKQGVEQKVITADEYEFLSQWAKHIYATKIHNTANEYVRLANSRPLVFVLPPGFDDYDTILQRICAIPYLETPEPIYDSRWTPLSGLIHLIALFICQWLFSSKLYLSFLPPSQAYNSIKGTMDISYDEQEKMRQDAINQNIIQYTIQGLKDPLNPTRCAGVLRFLLSHLDRSINDQFPDELWATMYNFLLAPRTDGQLKAVLRKLEKCTCKYDEFKFHAIYADYLDSERKAGNTLEREGNATTLIDICFQMLRWALKDDRVDIAEVKKGVFKRWPRSVSDVLPNGPDQLVQTVIQWNRIIPWTSMSSITRTLNNVTTICGELLADSFIKFDVMDKLFLDLGRSAMWSRLRLIEEGKIPEATTTILFNSIIGDLFDFLDRFCANPIKASRFLQGSESKVLQLCSVILFLIPTFSHTTADNERVQGVPVWVVLEVARRVFFRRMLLFGRPDFKVHPAFALRRGSVYLTNVEKLIQPEGFITRAMIVGRQDLVCGNTFCDLSFADISTAFKLCSHCLSCGYCSQSCQIKDWRNERFPHKKICPILSKIMDARGGWKAPVADRAEMRYRSKRMRLLLELPGLILQSVEQGVITAGEYEFLSQWAKHIYETKVYDTANEGERLANPLFALPPGFDDYDDVLNRIRSLPTLETQERKLFIFKGTT
ncbi:hypothetical protein CVT24_001768 [Panaeolus cyanescens]|uniref:phytol kinase n=1 Tax=Panaeolus cyanescens TaxID=181874 RepID=A0A409YU79_9AGAR|nr:hypothetical protein CVT24_001768 [Panaeolus cyanescens]